MTHFPDLETNSYVWCGPNIRAIGWLSAEHEFTRGLVDAELLVLLREHIATAYEFLISMGVHCCEFCQRMRGSKNLMIPTEHVIYIAPEMIVHYIEAHHYQPPVEFLAALKACPPQQSAEYLRRIAMLTSAPNITIFGGGQAMG